MRVGGKRIYRLAIGRHDHPYTGDIIFTHVLFLLIIYINCNSINNVGGQHRWLFGFSGSLLRANISIVSLFLLFDTVIIRGK